MAFKYTRAYIGDYVKNKKWTVYIPLLLFNAYIFYQVLRFSPQKSYAIVIMPAQAIDFMVHEVSHIATAFLPSLVTAASGSFSELLIGTLLIYGAFRTRCYFAAVLCSMWFMLACQSVGSYMADARSQKLDLVSLGAALSGGDTATHDWHFVFGKLHLLNLDTCIGNSVRFFGILIGLAGLAFGCYLMYLMASQADNQVPATEVLTPIQSFKTATPPASLYPTASRGRLSEAPHIPPTDVKEHQDTLHSK